MRRRSFIGSLVAGAAAWLSSLLGIGTKHDDGPTAMILRSEAGEIVLEPTRVILRSECGELVLCEGGLQWDGVSAGFVLDASDVIEVEFR